jgi:hypothetical protein
MEVYADIQHKRAMRAFFLEQRVSGGQLDANVTRQLEIAANARLRAAQLRAPAQQAAGRSLTVIARESGAGAVGRGPGLIERLMAGVTGSKVSDSELVLNGPEEDPRQVIDVKAEEG